MAKLVDGTHSAEKVTNEDDQLPWRDMWCIVQLLERPTLTLRIQHQQVAYFLQVLLRGNVIVDIYGSLKFFLLVSYHWRLAGRREWRCRKTRPIS
jgi:hypothetical protein